MSEETEICLSCGKVYKVIPEFKHRVCKRCKNAYLNGLEDAEERIIKLLEEQVTKWDALTIDRAEGISHYWVRLVSDAFIYAIKGEQK